MKVDYKNTKYEVNAPSYADIAAGIIVIFYLFVASCAVHADDWFVFDRSEGETRVNAAVQSSTHNNTMFMISFTIDGGCAVSGMYGVDGTASGEPAYTGQIKARIDKREIITVETNITDVGTIQVSEFHVYNNGMLEDILKGRELRIKMLADTPAIDKFSLTGSTVAITKARERCVGIAQKSEGEYFPEESEQDYFPDDGDIKF